MKPKEKATFMMNQINPFALDSPSDKSRNGQTNAKEICLILIDEVLLFSQKLGTILYQEVGTDSYDSRCKNADLASYYKEIKQELEKL